MARYKKPTVLPPETTIEVVAIKDNIPYKTEMTYSKALSMTKKKGWVYKFYQLGFSKFKIK